MAVPTLAHYLDVTRLADAFRHLNPHSAPGVDRVPWRRDKENLASHLEPLHEKLGNDTDGPHPVVRRLLPKSNGTLRPVGLPALEAKIVAKAVAMLLEAIYAQDVSDFSHGFRPGRSPHQTRHAGRQGLPGSRRGQVSDCDISAFFDTLRHDTLLAMLRKRLKDNRVLKRSEQWRPAGILDGTEMILPDKGSPQGSVISPLLAKVYLHEVLATGFETVVRAHGRGKVTLWRFADDGAPRRREGVLMT